MLPFLAMLVCRLLGGTINDRLTKWRGLRVGRCGLAVFSIAVAGIFIAFGSQVQGARLASVVLAGEQVRSICPRVLSGRNGRHWRRVLGLGIGLYEYGRPVGSGAHGYAYSLDRGPIRLDDLIPGRGCVMRGRCRKLAARRSIASTDGPTGRCPAARWFATPIGPIAVGDLLKSVELRRAAHRVGCPSRTKRPWIAVLNSALLLSFCIELPDPKVNWRGSGLTRSRQPRLRRGFLRQLRPQA